MPVRGESLLRNHQALSIHLENFRSECSCECDPQSMFLKRDTKTVWPWRGEPNSDHAVPTAATYSGDQLAKHLVTIALFPAKPRSAKMCGAGSRAPLILNLDSGCG